MTIIDKSNDKITDGARVKIGYHSLKTNTWIESYHMIKFNPIKGLKAEFVDFVNEEDKVGKNAPNIRSLYYELGDFKLSLHKDETYYLQIAENKMHNSSSQIRVVEQP